jgi:hypothetical protein
MTSNNKRLKALKNIISNVRVRIYHFSNKLEKSLLKNNIYKIIVDNILYSMSVISKILLQIEFKLAKICNIPKKDSSDTFDMHHVFEDGTRTTTTHNFYYCEKVESDETSDKKMSDKDLITLWINNVRKEKLQSTSNKNLLRVLLFTMYQIYYEFYFLLYFITFITIPDLIKLKVRK